MHAERAPLHRNRFDAVRVDDTSFGPHEVETPLEFVPAGERKHTIESIGRERPESIRGFRSPSVDHAMSAELADQARRRGAGCGGDDMSPALTGELNCDEGTVPPLRTPGRNEDVFRKSIAGS